MADNEKKTIPNLRFHFNSPVILSMTMISLLLLLLLDIVGNDVKHWFGIQNSGISNPLLYLRLFTHTFLHADFSHLASNYLLILSVGPMVEEKYGSIRLLVMVGVTSMTTGLITVFFFPDVLLMGSSGIVFMLMLIASFVNYKKGYIPITVIVVTIFFIGKEIADEILRFDEISQLSHVIGGLIGGVFGFLWRDPASLKKSS